MWMMTTRGFYSVVQHWDKDGTLLVRARAKKDLEQLCELPAMEKHAGEIVKSPVGSDYQYRIWKVPLTTWQAAQMELAEEIDYANFKDAVKKVDADRANVYMGVWSKLLWIAGKGWGKNPNPGQQSLSHVGDVIPGDEVEQVAADKNRGAAKYRVGQRGKVLGVGRTRAKIRWKAGGTSKVHTDCLRVTKFAPKH